MVFSDELAAKFVPSRLLTYLAQTAYGNGDDVVPRCDEVNWAVVFIADVSGFTALEARYKREEEEVYVPV